MAYVKVTNSKVTIDANIEKVFTFVTTPDNWVGTHPVTEAVDGGNTSRSEPLKASWVEHIKKPSMSLFQTTWVVEEYEKDKLWTIVSDPFGLTKSKIKITYIFSQLNDGVVFERTMYVDGESEIEGESLINNMKSTSDEQQNYMNIVKEKIEAE